MKRNNETSGDDNSNPSPVSKFMRLDLAAQQSSSALENPEGHGRGIVVTSSTEGTSSSSDPFCLTDLRASISSILPPTLASPPRPPRPKSRRGWSTDFVHRFEDTESTCDTQTSSDVISILSGNLITPPSNVTVHTTRERNFLDSGSPLTGSEGAMGGRKRARSSLATGKLESWANTVLSFGPRDLPKEWRLYWGPILTWWIPVLRQKQCRTWRRMNTSTSVPAPTPVPSPPRRSHM
ncbi:uncharacterized protein LOC118433254 [Folsomia candida]|uniref:uncharacterized protein LOC118433254 n=1 Tax=Folsomia candida TaxID=158441 RepID=UPI0016051CB0|nr:uncharacterized protein LOC118433254 [Folsomia candida]